MTTKPAISVEMATMSHYPFYAQVRQQPDGNYCVFTWNKEEDKSMESWREEFDVSYRYAMRKAQNYATQGQVGPRRPTAELTSN